MSILPFSLRTILLFLLMGILGAAPADARADPAGIAEVDAYVREYMDRNGIPGAALVVSRAGEITIARGYGSAGTGRPMTPDTPMFIGSQTKSLTALAVMQLVEAGLLDLDEPVKTYIPWFLTADPEYAGRITIRSLLNHTSGLSESVYAPRLPENATLEEAVRDLGRARSTADVGERFQYFNSGYSLLGYLIEVVSGESYEDYLQAHIFEPLGMDHSSVSIDDYAGMDIAQGHTQLFVWKVPIAQPVPRFYLPAGFAVSTAGDMARFLMAMENGGVLDGNRVLSEAGVRQMFLPDLSNDSSAGFGWHIAQYYGEKQITHGGATEAFNTHVLILPERGLTAVLLVNQDHMFKAIYDYEPLFWGVIDRLTGHPVTEQEISSIAVGRVILAVFLLVVFQSARGLLALRRERTLQQKSAPGTRWRRCIGHVIWIAFTLVMVVLVGPGLADRAFDLRWFTGFYPDVALLAAIVLSAETLQLLVKAGTAGALAAAGRHR